MKKNLSTQAIKAMAIGMALTMASTASLNTAYAISQDSQLTVDELEALPVSMEEVSEDLESDSVSNQAEITTVNQANAVIDATPKGERTVVDLSNINSFDEILTISQGKDIVLTANKKLTDIKVKLNGGATLTLNNLTIESTQANGGTIEVVGTGNKIYLEGNNTFTGKKDVSTEAIKVAPNVFNGVALNEVTVAGDGNLTVENYKTGIGSSEELKYTSNYTDSNGFYSQKNIVIDTTGTITLNNISSIGIGYKFENLKDSKPKTVFTDVITSGVINNGNINITTVDKGMGVGVYEMNGGNVSIDFNYVFTQNTTGTDSTKDIRETLRPAFSAKNMTGGTLKIDVNNPGIDAKPDKGLTSSVGAHIINVLGGDIDINLNAKNNAGLLTTYITKGNINITATVEEGPQDGIKFYDFDRLWTTGQPTDPERLGIKPANFNDLSISMKGFMPMQSHDPNVNDREIRYLKKREQVTQPDIKTITDGNFLKLEFDKETVTDLSSYSDLTINGNFKPNVKLEDGRTNYIFNLPNGDISATLSKGNEKYVLVNKDAENNLTLGNFNGDDNLLDKKDVKLIENKVIANVGDDEFTFEILSSGNESNSVALVGHRKAGPSRQLTGTSFANGQVTVNEKVYNLTKIGNGKDRLTTVTNDMLEGNTANVTEVSNYAFENNKEITKADFPKVEKVGTKAFANTNITTADLGSEANKTKIESDAFSGNTNKINIATNENSKNDILTNVSGNLTVNGSEKPTSSGSSSGGSSSGGGSFGGSGGSSGNAIITAKPNDVSTETTSEANNSNNTNNIYAPSVENKELSVDVIKLPSAEGEAKGFDDVDASHWAKTYIDKLSTAGIINGSDAMFNPNGQTKRADVTIMLVKLLGLSPEVNDKFTDVNPNSYYAPYVGTASTYGIVNGSNGMFNPEGIISRQDTMVMIGQILKSLDLNVNTDTTSLNQFSDVNNVAPYANESVAILVNSGIISGNNGKLNPKAPVTRAEMATIMSKLYDVLDQAK